MKVFLLGSVSALHPILVDYPKVSLHDLNKMFYKKASIRPVKSSSKAQENLGRIFMPLVRINITKITLDSCWNEVTQLLNYYCTDFLAIGQMQSCTALHILW